MMNILDKIAANKRLEVEELKVLLPEKQLRNKISNESDHRFLKAIERSDKINIIAEIKKGSPSKGIISEDFDPAALATAYNNGGASVLSVLTERMYFFGDTANMKIASDASGLPILCKDFIIDSYQLYHARAHGADAVLLIVRLLEETKLLDLFNKATETGLDCLVEVHNEAELETALKINAPIIGVNNRNLDTFEVNLDTSERLAKMIPEKIVKVAESGIFVPKDISRLKASGYFTFLIGEALVRSDNPAELIKSLREA